MATNNESIPPVEDIRRLFDLADSDGLNDSERILTSLCKKSFLRLWSQPNVFTDEGFKNGKASTRELCDALVIFGSDIIVFSDKHVTFQTNKDLSVAWGRWYKRAILESCQQLHGARSWLQRFPNRTFLDAKCTRPLPVTVPTDVPVRIHLVAVTRGSREPALAFNGGLGSLALDSSIEGDAHLRNPFAVGLPEPSKHFVHVLDEVSVELLLSELDTAADLLDYLNKREALLGRRGTLVSACGEEDLLALYLGTMNSDESEHVFFNIPDGEGQPDTVLLDTGIYQSLKDKPEYIRKKQADLISYEWDKLVDRFLEYGDPSLQSQYVNQTAVETEQGLRLMAAETRFRRRQLAEVFIGALRNAAPGERRSRLCPGNVPEETVYVFLVVPKRADDTYDDYRQYRLAVLHAYVKTAKLIAPLGTTFVGIAFDNIHKDYRGGSEDMFILMQKTWTIEEMAELESKRREFGLWGDAMEVWRYRQDEFPQADQRIALERINEIPTKSTQSRVVDKKKTANRLKKMQKASKRKNRKK
ncbi:MAG: hypothetical protein Q7T66_16005 [Herminiimonas sp.]|uniref:hypothetical protein n=1 Tax=Herminiimonas sp. TaxID=1926289 RepID=UPI00271628C3|nr:hypothetical protein [Herminiimonas sp.]MDO9422165.1 hypothetical protein [Herminiimonas sp.]